jgi:hypothetical protein
LLCIALLFIQIYAISFNEISKLNSFNEQSFVAADSYLTQSNVFSPKEIRPSDAGKTSNLQFALESEKKYELRNITDYKKIYNGSFSDILRIKTFFTIYFSTST